ncbi:MAG TPA: FixH family protein [Gaiellaceae bacterium]|nr:FixH family protein [Gaiellaceae bacterium]
MRTLVLTLATAAALAVAGTASAGGWATAGVSPLPADPTAGSTWDAKITILQHGRTPLVGVQPTISLVGSGGERKTFAAKATDEPGVYLAEVKFPAAGSWSYEVYDGFTQYGGAQTHTFGTISVGPGSGGSGLDLPSLPVSAAILLGVAAAIALALGMRRARPRPAPQI